MKMKKITYLLLIIVFFNLLTLLFYYLKLIDSYGFKFSENIVINAKTEKIIVPFTDMQREDINPPKTIKINNKVKICIIFSFAQNVLKIGS